MADDPAVSMADRILGKSTRPGVSAAAGDFTINAPVANPLLYSTSARYYPNIESYPGDLAIKPPLTSAKREVRIGRRDAVRQARALTRSNELIRGGIEKRVQTVVGATLRVMPQPNWKLLADAAPSAGFTAKWAKEFAAQCYRQFNDWGFDQRLLQDAEGHYNFGGMMALAFRNLAGPDAETAGAIHYDQARADAYRHRWATYVTVLDPDRIQTRPEDVNNDLVSDGRELDVNGRMTALWVTVGHPGDGGMDAIDYVRLPRENDMGRPMAWHYFTKTRAQQQRGLTAMVTIMRASGMLGQFDDAQIGHAVKAASLAAYVKTSASAQTMGENLAPAKGSTDGFDDKLDLYGKLRLRLGTQRLPILAPDDEIVLAGLSEALADPSAIRNGFIREFASALGISFEQISNNFSEANYSSARAALLEMWRGVMMDRVLFCSHVPSLIYSAVIEEAIAKGRITLPAGAPDFYEYRAAYTNCSWTGPAMGWIDPQKEANAQATRLENMTTTRQKEIAADGGDWSEVFEQRGEEEEYAEECGIVLTVAAGNNGAIAEPEPGEDMTETGEPGAPSNDNQEAPPMRQKIRKGAA